MKKSYLFMSVLALLLVSCTDNKTSDSSSVKSSSTSIQLTSSTTQDSTTSNDESSSSTVTLNDKVVESEWKQAFDEIDTTNATCSRTFGTQKMILEMESATKVHVITNDSVTDNSFVETYMAVIGTTRIKYVRSNPTSIFTKRAPSESEFNNELSSYIEPISMMSSMVETLDLKNNYSKFSYDTKKQGYVGDITMEPVPGQSTTMNVVLKFDEKDITYISLNTDKASSTGVGGDMEYNKFGTTVVELPSLINETEWKQAINDYKEEDNYITSIVVSKNSVFKAQLSIQFENVNRFKVLKDGDARFAIDDSGEEYQEYIYDYDGTNYNQYYRYSRDGEYTKEEITKTIFDKQYKDYMEKSRFLDKTFDTERNQLVDCFSLLTLDEEARQYNGELRMQLDENVFESFEYTFEFSIKQLINVAARGSIDGEIYSCRIGSINTVQLTIPSAQ